jgi:hypothetical protein
MHRNLTRLLAASAIAVCLTGAQASAQAPQDPNLTVVPRSTAAPKLGGQGQVSVSAFLTENSPRIAQGLVWRVYRDKATAGGKGLLVSTHRDASPTLRLDPGNYWINAALGRAHLTRKIAVVGDEATEVRFILNAGGLRLNPQLANGEAANAKLVAFDVESDERDQHGQRTKVVTGARAGVVLRLNAGIYSIVSTYGDANAVARADVSVEAGKLSDITLRHAAAEVSFKLVTRGGGDAIADTQWTVATAAGEKVKESSGAVPTHILAPGSYMVHARHAGRPYRRTFAVKAGDRVLVEVVMP